MGTKIELKDIADSIHALSGLDIRLRTRKRQYFYGRMVYCKIAREYTYNTLESIGKEVGIKHDTTIHCLKRFEQDIYNQNNKKLYDSVLWELGLKKQEDDKEILKPTNLELLQLSVLRELKELSYAQLSEFHETRLKPYKKALESRVMPKVIIEEQGAMLNI